MKAKLCCKIQSLILTQTMQNGYRCLIKSTLVESISWFSMSDCESLLYIVHQAPWVSAPAFLYDEKEPAKRESNRKKARIQKQLRAFSSCKAGKWYQFALELSPLKSSNTLTNFYFFISKKIVFEEISWSKVEVVFVGFVRFFTQTKTSSRNRPIMQLSMAKQSTFSTLLRQWRAVPLLPAVCSGTEKLNGSVRTCEYVLDGKKLLKKTLAPLVIPNNSHLAYKKFHPICSPHFESVMERWDCKVQVVYYNTGDLVCQLLHRGRFHAHLRDQRRCFLFSSLI